MDFHNRRSIRKTSHDYSQPCSYFITINIRFGQCLFGNALSPTEIRLNELGKTAQKFWLEIPEHFSHVTLGEFVVMPNHLHGIIHIGDLNNTTLTTGDARSRHVVTDNCQTQGLQHFVTNKPNTPNQFGPLPKGSLAVIIGQYKSSVTRWANQNKFGGLFSWHSLFYDRIISDSSTLYASQVYIRQNPENWWMKYRDQSW